MTRYGKTETSPPRISRKYKMAKNIQTPPRIYDYIAELSCYAKSEQNRLTHFFSWGNRGSLSFLLTHTQSISQTNSFVSSTDHIWKDLKQLSWLKSRGFTPRCAFWGYRWWQIMFSGSKFPQNRFFLGLNGPFKQKRPKNSNRLAWKLVSRSWNFHRVYIHTPLSGLHGWFTMSNNKYNTADMYGHFE